MVERCVWSAPGVAGFGRACDRAYVFGVVLGVDEEAGKRGVLCSPVKEPPGGCSGVLQERAPGARAPHVSAPSDAAIRREGFLLERGRCLISHTWRARLQIRKGAGPFLYLRFAPGETPPFIYPESW